MSGAQVGSEAFRVPDELSQAILDGRCVAFVGAGFSAGAALTWQKLLLELARGVSHRVEGLAELIERSGASALGLEAAGQLIRDAHGEGDQGQGEFQRAVKEALARHTAENERIRRRHQLLRQIPFHAILTTNFDGLLPGEAPEQGIYGALLSETTPWWARQDRDSGRGLASPVVKLHGDAFAEPSHRNPVVLARSDYRRLLYEDRRYGDFLRSLFATRVVLFLGTSFTDAYLNEIRSQVVALAGDRFRAYAVLADKPEAEQVYFRKHEGIEVLSYRTQDGDHAGFDRWLEAIHDVTSPESRLRRLVSGKTVVWVDAHPENNDTGLATLEDAGATVETLTAPELLEEARHSTAAFLVTNYGGPDKRDPVAPRLLRQVNRWAERPPVIVFAGSHDAVERRRSVLRLGAFEYCYGWNELFRVIELLNRAPGD